MTRFNPNSRLPHQETLALALVNAERADYGMAAVVSLDEVEDAEHYLDLAWTSCSTLGPLLTTDVIVELHEGERVHEAAGDGDAARALRHFAGLLDLQTRTAMMLDGAPWSERSLDAARAAHESATATGAYSDAPLAAAQARVLLAVQESQTISSEEARDLVDLGWLMPVDVQQGRWDLTQAGRQRLVEHQEDVRAMRALIAHPVLDAVDADRYPREADALVDLLAIKLVSESYDSLKGVVMLVRVACLSSVFGTVHADQIAQEMFARITESAEGCRLVRRSARVARHERA